MVNEVVPEELRAPFNLADWVEANPEVANEIFGDINHALHMVLPGAGFHDRYDGAQTQFGLALIVENDEIEAPNPITEPDKLIGEASLVLTNHKLIKDSEKVWAWKDTDREVLGASSQVPEHLGRFVVVGAAKLVTLDGLPEDVLSSHSISGPKIGEGSVGFAGGKRQAGSLTAVSGLWEVHDHIVASVFGTAAESIANETEASGSFDRRLAIMQIIQNQFDQVQDILDAMDKKASDLTHEEVHWLVQQIDQHYLDNVED